MSMVYLANVQCVETDKGLNFYTIHEHVAVDFPSDEQPNYLVLSLFDHLDLVATKDFAKAMDTAAEMLKRAERKAYA